MNQDINLRTENTEPHLSLSQLLKPLCTVLTLMIPQHIQDFSQVPWGWGRWVAGREAFSVCWG